MPAPLPGRDVPLVDPTTGQMTDIWYLYFQQHQNLSQLPDVAATPPANGQVLIWNSTTQRWTPGAN